MSNIIAEEEIQIRDSLVDPTVHLDDLPDIDVDVDVLFSTNISGTTFKPDLNFIDDGNAIFDAGIHKEVGIKQTIQRNRVLEEEDEIQIGEALIDPNFDLNNLSDNNSDENDETIIKASIITPALPTLKSKESQENALASKTNVNLEPADEEVIPSTRVLQSDCLAAFEISAKNLGLQDIECNKNITNIDVASTASSEGSMGVLSKDSKTLGRKNAVRIPTTSENANSSIPSVTINTELHDDYVAVNETTKTSENDVKNLNPKPIKISSGNKHSKTKHYDKVLSNYDIIDRTEAKNIQPIPEPFSFLRVINRIRSTLVLPVPSKADVYDRDSENHPFVLSTTIVNLSIQQTNEGEQMQVITLGKSKSMEKVSSKGIIVVVDELNKDDLRLGSDGESISSDSDEDDDYGQDSPDSVTKKSYDLPQLQIQEKFRSKNEGDGKKPTNIFRGGISKSFGAFDKDPIEMINRRATMGSGIVPFKPSDMGTLKRKTLPSEPFHLITDGYPTNVPSFPSDRRSLIALEIYTTERTFVRGMEIIVKHFKKWIEMGNFLDAKEMKLVFGNIEHILSGNNSLFDDIFDRISDWSDEQCIGDVFLNYLDHFKIYSDYAKNYDTSEALIKEKLKKKKDLETLLATCYTNPVCMPGLTLPSYLITVIQRIPRYILLLKDLIKRTSNTHPDYDNLVKSQEMMERVAKFINEQLKQAQCAKALEALQSRIVGLKAYYTPDRNLVHEGDVCLLTSKKTYHCVLFNDLLVFAVKGGVRQSAVELTLDIKTVWIEDLDDLDPQTTKKDAIGIYTPDRPYTMYVGSNGEKKIWIKNIVQAIRQNLHGKNAADDVDLETRETSHTYKDECLYSGQFHKAKKHGQGTKMWPNQMTYNGNWQDDERNGYGVLEYFSGDVYEGQWMDNKQEGKGVYKYNSGGVVTGEWKDGMKHGPIEVFYNNGDYFKGNFVHDRIEGDGELKCKNGFEYKGEWKINLKHGKGTLKTSDGLEYTGNFKYNRFHGNGELRYDDSSFYKGEFEQGQRCGQGIYTVPGGVSYEGQWSNDLMNGKGKIVYENGDIYDGTWVDNLRIGQGVLTYNFGGYYRGQWQAGLRHGSGLLETKDGSLYEGEFFNNMMNGSGKMKYRNGTIYTGQWQDNLPNGKGVLTKPGGYICDGNWVLGRQNGYCTLRDAANNYQYEGEWGDGAKEGRGRETLGSYLYEGEFAENLRHGGGNEKSPDSSSYEGKWSRGRKHGKGIKKKTIGVVEYQVWDNGCLVKTNIQLPPAELPIISRDL